MRNIRLIARLDVKKEWLIKGVQMEGWRKIGDPAEHAARYGATGADELLFMDVVASLYERNNLHDTVRSVASSVFVPLTVGGGIRTVDDAGALLSCGADKVAVNTGATKHPELLTALSDTYGAQATVVSIEAINTGPGTWHAMTDNGRNQTGRDVVEWAREAADRGAGEICLTSIDRDGTKSGYDLALVRAVCDAVGIPVIASGGLGNATHLGDLIEETDVSAAAIAQALHSGSVEFEELRNGLAAHDCFVRQR